MATVLEIEQRRLVEQQRLDQRKGANERNRCGQFATPPALSLDIAQYARRLWRRRSDKVRFLDPACGTGSFYAALCQAFPTSMIAKAAGIEIDPDLADVASALWGRGGLGITVGDFTRQTPPPGSERFNLILANPPYVRHHHLSGAEKQRLRAQVGDDLGLAVSGLAGLYCYFLLLCDKWLADDGLALWLIPSEFMDVNYGTALRRYFTSNTTLLRIHRFCPSDVQFSDALVSSVVVAFRKSRPRESYSAFFSFGGRLSTPGAKERVPLAELRTANKWTRYPRREAARVSDKVCPVTLGELFTIKRGLATGANRFFILPKDRAAHLGIPRECTRPILPSPRYLKELVIESLSDGYPHIDQPLSLIDCPYSEDEVRRRFPRFWTYLRLGKKRNIHKGYLASRRTPWYSQEQRDPAPFLCTYMGRAASDRKPFRFLWNKSKATAPNVYLMLYPKGALKAALSSDPSLCHAVFDILQSTSLEMFLGESRVYGGGLYKLEPNELARVSAGRILAGVEGVKLQRQLELFG